MNELWDGFSPENRCLCYFFVLGMWSVFLYDTVLLLRKVIPTGKLLAFLEEFILVGYLGKDAFSFMYSYTGGRLRWYMVIGFMVGMFSFHKLVSGYYLKYVEKFLMMFLSGGWIKHGRK